ncbi:hypothetical protein AWC19_11990 [Mycobacterium palustre]|uniref:Uncharacterized protein n=2 Tax=Mycobacterium palustre TaxID=153971 RepID=A0A1X1ZIY3_9MYCO|nr:hypothetical protein AWC19_11990 [Mycobacterium palustre]
MGFIPPPSPSASAEQIREMYIAHQTRIRVGLILTVVSCGLAFPWAVAIAVQMQRIEGRWSPMALSQLIAGVALPLLYIMPVMAWASAAFRPDERPAELTRFANDLGWFPFVGVGSPAFIQSIAIAIVTLRDIRPNPVFKRWVAYFNIWCVLLFFAGALIYAFKSGPLAWNGVVAFWIPVVVFVAWIFVMTYVLLAAINDQEDELNATPAGIVEFESDLQHQVNRLSSELESIRQLMSRQPAPAQGS